MASLIEEKSDNRAVAENVFSMINQSYSFNNESVRTLVVGEDIWFCGRDIANILGYKNNSEAISMHVRTRNKAVLRDLLKIEGIENCYTATSNEKASIYLNEPGLYSLIMKSKLKLAEQFQDWVTDEVLPSIRKLGQEKYLKELKAAQAQITEQAGQLSRLHDINKELLSYKLLSTRNETIYIVSTSTLAKQGLYKVGRTKSIKSRNSSHNTTHPVGDKVHVLAEFKVNSASLVETTLLKKLDGLRPSSDSEYVMCPFDLLFDFVEAMTNLDGDGNHLVNNLIETVFKLKTKPLSPEDWTRRIDPDILDEQSITLVQNKKEIAKCDPVNSTQEQKEAFFSKCLDAYLKMHPHDGTAIVWREFQVFMRNYGNIPKSIYRALQWRPFMEGEKAARNLAIQWQVKTQAKTDK